MPSSRATCAIGLPLVCIKRTASRLNSALEVFCTFFMLVSPLSGSSLSQSFLYSTKPGEVHISGVSSDSEAEILYASLTENAPDQVFPQRSKALSRGEKPRDLPTSDASSVGRDLCLGHIHALLCESSWLPQRREENGSQGSNLLDGRELQEDQGIAVQIFPICLNAIVHVGRRHGKLHPLCAEVLKGGTAVIDLKNKGGIFPH